jgi:DNA-binding transcriptional LysR family regulator
MDQPLKTFLAVARCGSLSQAARELFLSQPAVSKQIRKLEAQHKATLLRRHERGVELTPAGRLLADYAAQIAGLEAQAAEELAALGGELAGRLRLGATLTLGEYVLPPIIGRFKAAHPAIEILLEVENTVRVVEHVVAGVYDAGLIEGPAQHHLARFEKLADDELLVVAAADHRLVGRQRVELAELAAEGWILREPGSGTRAVFEEALRAAGCDPQRLELLMQLGSTQAIKNLVAHRVGLSALSQWTVREELADGRLTALAVPALDLHRTFRWVLAHGSRPSLPLRRFERCCREALA